MRGNGRTGRGQNEKHLPAKDTGKDRSPATDGRPGRAPPGRGLALGPEERAQPAGKQQTTPLDAWVAGQQTTPLDAWAAGQQTAVPCSTGLRGYEGKADQTRSEPTAPLARLTSPSGFGYLFGEKKEPPS